eukprot:3052245-Lingulodinium_polyedra.AAC.1
MVGMRDRRRGGLLFGTSPSYHRADPAHFGAGSARLVGQEGARLHSFFVGQHLHVPPPPALRH